MQKYHLASYVCAVGIWLIYPAILPGCGNFANKQPDKQPDKTPVASVPSQESVKPSQESDSKSAFDRMIVALAQEIQPKANIPIVIGAITKDNTEEPSALSPFIIASLENCLLSRGATIATHNRLSELLITQKIQFSSLFNQEQRPQIGKWLAVKAMIFGKVFYEAYQCRIALELIDLELATVSQSSVRTIACGDLPPVVFHQLQLQYQAAKPRQTQDELPPTKAERHFLGVSPFFSPAELQTQLGPLLQYLSAQTGVTLELKVAKDYDELLTWLREGSVSSAHLSPYAFIKASERGNITLLATVVNEGAETVRSLVITHAQSPIEKLKDLQGRTFAFVDTRSTSGFIYPRMLLIKMGYDPSRFLGKTVFCGDHLSVIAAVLSGKCDAGAVYDGALKVAERNGYAVGQLRVLARSEPLPPDPYVALKSLNASLQNKFTQALLTLSKQTSPGQEILAKIGWIEGWQAGKEERYSPLRDFIYYGRERMRLGILPITKADKTGETGFQEELQEIFMSGLVQTQRFFLVTLGQLPAADQQENWMALGQEKNVQLILEPRLIPSAGKFSLSVRVYECKGGKLDKIYMSEWLPGEHKAAIARIMSQLSGDHPLCGVVIESEQRRFRIDLGQSQSVRLEDSVDVYKLAEERRNPVTGEVVGIVEQVVAKGKVVELFYDTATCQIEGDGEVAIGDSVRVYAK